MKSSRTLGTLASLAIALLTGAAVMRISGYDPAESYRFMFLQTLMDSHSLASALALSAPIMLTAVTFAVGLRAGLFNVGAEGQVYMGALGAVLASYLAGDWRALPLSFIMGTALAIAWALIPATLRAFRGVNEVVSTIMMNWTAYWLVVMSVSTQLANPLQPEESVKVPEAARMGPLIPGTNLTASVPLSIAAAVVAYLVSRWTVWGYRMAVVGANPTLARSYGIEPSRYILLSFVIGGISAGLAGVLQVVANPPSYSLARNLANVYGLGFDGITAAMLGGGHPLGSIPASLLLGVMYEGARYMQIGSGTPFELVKLVQGIIVLGLSIYIFRTK